MTITAAEELRAGDDLFNPHRYALTFVGWSNNRPGYGIFDGQCEDDGHPIVLSPTDLVEFFMDPHSSVTRPNVGVVFTRERGA